jgi:ankyrin repeat protein/pimeloyl-ACP methyl ester carboxylesterase
MRIGVNTLSIMATPFPQGIKILAEPKRPVIDIVFVHGLTGDRERTWTSHRPPHDVVFWPRDLLPAEIPDARIMTFGYDAYVTRRQPVSTNRVADHAKDLLNALQAQRMTLESRYRPLILVAHSLGGIVCKDMLLASRQSTDNHLLQLSDSNIAIAFIGTPHAGSGLAKIARISARSLGLVTHTNHEILSVLDSDSETLQQIHDRFLADARSSRAERSMICFYETLPLPVIGLVVPKDSAVISGYASGSIHANHRDMVRFQSVEDPGFQSILAELRRWTINARDRIARKEQLFLDSLQFPEMGIREITIDTPAAYTCAWLSSNALYQDWLHRKRLPKSRGLLWIKGKPGSGKSTLMKHALKELTKISKALNSICINHFFNARGNKVERSAEGLYRTLLRQLCLQCPEMLKDCIDWLRDGTLRQVEWRSWTQLRDFLHMAISQRGYPSIRIIIDALDECSEEEVRAIVHSFEVSAAEAFSNDVPLSICWSSRHYPHITVLYGFELKMEEQNMSDIRIYAKERLSSVAHIPEHEELEKKVVAKSSGIFLWVVIVVQMLVSAAEGGWGLDNLEALLQTLPPRLDHLYQELISQTVEKDRTQILLLFRWVLFSRKTLTIDQLQVALAFSGEKSPTSLEKWNSLLRGCEKRDAPARGRKSHFQRYVTHLSAGLIEVVEGKMNEDDVSSKKSCQPMQFVQVIHESVRDFFRSENVPPLFGLKTQADFTEAAEGCLSYACARYVLASEMSCMPPAVSVGIADPELSSQIAITHRCSSWVDHRFTGYVRNYLFVHVAAASGFPEKGVRVGQMMVGVKEIYDRWLSLTPEPCIIQESYKWAKLSNEVLEMKLGCLSALHPCLVATLGNREQVKASGRLQKYALIAAAHDRQGKLMEELLQDGAETSEVDPNGRTALHEAVIRYHSSGVLCLLEWGADIEAKDVNHRTALHLATLTKHEDMVELLVGHDADVNSENQENETALHLAARTEQYRLVKWLVKSGAKVDARNRLLRTPLMEACSVKSQEALRIVRFLLTQRASLHDVDHEGHTPLALAALSGNYCIASLLIKEGASVHAKNHYGISILCCAAQAKDRDCTLLLLRNGAKTFPTDLPWMRDYVRQIQVENLKRRRESSSSEEGKVDFDKIPI